RLPKFLPTASANWAATGLTLAYILCTAAIYWVTFSGGPLQWFEQSSTLLPLLLILSGLGIFHFHKFVSQKLKIPSFITTIVVGAMLFIMGLTVYQMIRFGTNWGFHAGSLELLEMLSVPAALWLIYAFWRIWRAR